MNSIFGPDVSIIAWKAMKNYKEMHVVQLDQEIAEEKGASVAVQEEKV